MARINSTQALRRAWRMLGEDENDDIFKIHALIASRIWEITRKAELGEKLMKEIKKHKLFISEQFPNVIEIIHDYEFGKETK